jgi:hypothetical protein
MKRARLADIHRGGVSAHERIESPLQAAGRTAIEDVHVLKVSRQWNLTSLPSF